MKQKENNMTIKQHGNTGKIRTAEQKELISKRTREAMQRPEVMKKVIKANSRSRKRKYKQVLYPWQKKGGINLATKNINLERSKSCEMIEWFRKLKNNGIDTEKRKQELIRQFNCYWQEEERNRELYAKR